MFSINYLPYIQSMGIILSFLIAAFTTWRALRVNRVSTYIDIVKSHRDIWSLPMKGGGLERVTSSTPDDLNRDISDNEIMFICFVINHISCSFELMKIDNLINPEGLEVDVKSFFSLPIPRRVWDKTKHFRNKDFKNFMERNIIDSAL